MMCQARSQGTFQLAPPLIKYNSAFFKKQVTASLLFAMPGTQIHYTLNGTTPTVNDAVYTRPITISKSNTILQAKVFGAGYLPSETVEAHFYKKGFPVQSVTTSPATAPYIGEASKLTDGVGGRTSINAGSWLGYKTDTIELIAVFAKNKKINTAVIHFLQDQNSWIFLPLQVNVYIKTAQSREWVLKGQIPVLYNEKLADAKCVGLQLPLQSIVTTKEIKLQIINSKEIPEWHPGRGTKGWVFIDEINFY